MSVNLEIQLNRLSKDKDLTVRIEQDDVRLLLLENRTVTLEENKGEGKERFIQCIPLGENVFAAKLLPEGWDPLFGTILLDAGTEWITQGTGLVLKKPCCCC